MELAEATGWSESEIMLMPFGRFRAYLRQVPYIQARRLRDMVWACSAPHMDESGRRQMERFLKKELAAPDGRDRGARVQSGWAMLKAKLGGGK